MVGSTWPTTASASIASTRLLIHTPLWDELAKGFIPEMGNTVEEVFASLTERLTIKRMGRIEEVGSAVAFLASDAKAGFVTGQCWNVDGGYTRTL